jgi:hypothetical protein
MSIASRKHAFRSGDHHTLLKIDPLPRQGLAPSYPALRTQPLDQPVPMIRRPDRLMGERVRRVEQALAIMREGGGVLAQQVTSGAPSGQPRTFTDEAEFKRWFPVWMDKDEHIVVKGLKPNVPRPFC